MPKMPDADVILHGLLVSLDEKRNFETKALSGYRATVIGAGGGAAVVNFDLTTPLPFSPIMGQVVWVVRSAPWDMGSEGGNGMSTKFIREVDATTLGGLANLLEENAARYPEAAKK